MVDLNRTTISRYTFVPQIEWYSQVHPNLGLQIPKTSTRTPTGEVSSISCFFLCLQTEERESRERRQTMEWHLKKWNLKTQRYPTSATYRNLEGGVGSFGGSAVVKITVSIDSGCKHRNLQSKLKHKGVNFYFIFSQ